MRTRQKSPSQCWITSKVPLEHGAFSAQHRRCRALPPGTSQMPAVVTRSASSGRRSVLAGSCGTVLSALHRFPRTAGGTWTWCCAAAGGGLTRRSFVLSWPGVSIVTARRGFNRAAGRYGQRGSTRSRGLTLGLTPPAGASSPYKVPPCGVWMGRRSSGPHRRSQERLPARGRGSRSGAMPGCHGWTMRERAPEAMCQRLLPQMSPVRGAREMASSIRASQLGCQRRVRMAAKQAAGGGASRTPPPLQTREV